MTNYSKKASRTLSKLASAESNRLMSEHKDNCPRYRLTLCTTKTHHGVPVNNQKQLQKHYGLNSHKFNL